MVGRGDRKPGCNRPSEKVHRECLGLPETDTGIGPVGAVGSEVTLELRRKGKQGQLNEGIADKRNVGVQKAQLNGMNKNLQLGYIFTSFFYVHWYHFKG